MRKLLAYPLTIIYFLFFGLLLLLFHPIQVICYNVFGYNAHRISVAMLNGGLTRCLHILGFTYRFEVPDHIPTDQPVIIVSNHQSMNDIPPIIWFMRRFHPKFISKKELGRGFPSVSYNLRVGGSVLIERKNPRQALTAIANMAAYIEAHKRAVVIFPEGTRSRTGAPKPFQTKGLTVLFRKAPNAIVIPITINNSYKTLPYGKFPMGIGHHITFTVHDYLKVKDYDVQDLINKVEHTITNAIKST
jgi:1-acyl-sn-glycerol-3-phosphate acyltransferase